MKTKIFAKVEWHIEDLTEYGLTKKQAEKFLIENEKILIDKAIEAGREFIQYKLDEADE